MEPAPGEPRAGPWRRERITDVVDALKALAGPLPDRPFILSVDGRASSGKSSLANRICQVVPSASVVHTDDIAWHHSRFGWTDLLTDGVLVPLRQGKAVSYRPAAWDLRGRAGAIEVPA